MADGIQDYINILDENILQGNIKFASMFIMNFECLKDYFVSQMREFLSDEYGEKNGELQVVESQKYKDEVKRLGKDRLSAALAWFNELDAISLEDIQLFYKARERRNSITHEFISELMHGFSQEDIELFGDMLALYRKVDRWWINEIEILISGEWACNEYDTNAVMGGQALVLSLINDVTFGKAEAYSELLQSLRQMSAKN